MKVHYRLLFSLLLVSVIFPVSCRKNGSDVLNLPQSPFVLDYRSGASASAEFVFDSDWHIGIEYNDLFVAEPDAGTAGTQKVSVKALEDNEGIMERVSVLTVETAASGKKDMYIIQKAKPGVKFQEQPFEIVADQEKASIYFDTNEKVEVTEDTDWMEIESVECSDSVMLPDGHTYSDSLRYRIGLSVQVNDGSEPRSSRIKVVAPSGEYELEVLQNIPQKIEWDKDFYRRSAVVRFTATWCYNCPGMAKAISKAQESMPDRIIQINMHSISSEGGLGFYQVEKFETLYDIPGYPSGIMNNYAKISNEKSVDDLAAVVTDLAEEAITSYKPVTAVNARSSISDGKVKVDVNIAAKESGDYGVCIFLLENGMVYPQAGDDMKYEHNYVVRNTLTENLFGDPVSVTEDRSVVKYSVEADIPRSVCDENNLFVVAVVTKSGNPDVKTVEKAEYMDLGTIWDNAVCISADGGYADYKYEE